MRVVYTQDAVALLLEALVREALSSPFNLCIYAGRYRRTRL